MKTKVGNHFRNLVTIVLGISGFESCVKTIVLEENTFDNNEKNIFANPGVKSVDKTKLINFSAVNTSSSLVVEDCKMEFADTLLIPNISEVAQAYCIQSKSDLCKASFDLYYKDGVKLGHYEVWLRVADCILDINPHTNYDLVDVGLTPIVFNPTVEDWN